MSTMPCGCFFLQAAALEELGSRDAELSAQKAALDERSAELDAWAAQVGGWQQHVTALCCSTRGLIERWRHLLQPQRSTLLRVGVGAQTAAALPAAIGP
jgi:hypothetical protein